MVISQIAGLATAFGTGELSGAGFGPNYTILMKLGYEFFAPRILEEMEKNPNVFFQDTLWFKKFQKQIKLYSDKVMKETLDTLLTIPQETIDSIQNKFQETLETTGGGFGSQGLNDLIKIFGLFMKATSANQLLIGSAVQFAAAQPGHGGTGTLPDQPLTPQDIVGGDSPPIPPEEPQGPPAPSTQTQEQIFNSTSTYLRYRQAGGLLLENAWHAKRNALDIRPSNWEAMKNLMRNKYPEVNGPSEYVQQFSKRRATQSSSIQKQQITSTIANLGKGLKTIIRTPINDTSRALYDKTFMRLRQKQQSLFDLIWLYSI